MSEIFAFADLHGRYDLWEKIKARVQPNDVLISLGDCIDRGPQGLEIYKDLRARPHTYMIKGNHEDLAEKAIPILAKDNWYGREITLWFQNGGTETFKELEPLNKSEWYELVQFFKTLPKELMFLTEKGLIHCDHSGYTPNFQGCFEPYWDREHFNDDWRGLDREYMLHGHTPVQYLKKELHMKLTEDFIHDPEIIVYNDGHKIDIDLGSIISNKTALFNLNTFEVEYVK